MRRVAAVLILILVAAAPPLVGRAQAQDKNAPAAGSPTKRRAGDRTKFYDFDELLVGGQLRTPNAYFASARQRLRWNRLLRLKKSFLPLLLGSDKYPILRVTIE